MYPLPFEFFYYHVVGDRLKPTQFCSYPLWVRREQFVKIFKFFVTFLIICKVLIFQWYLRFSQRCLPIVLSSGI
jgi:hypothetical protein